MLKFRNTFMAMMVVGFVAMLSSSAHAQLPQSAVEQLTAKYRSAGPCRDPWITIAFMDAYASTRPINGVGSFGDCDSHRYNNGSWSSYAQLYQAVKTAVSNQNTAGLRVTKESLSNGTWRISTDAGNGFRNSQIISHDGGTLITSDGAGLIVASVVSQGGGNLVGSGGSSVVSQGGGNILTNNGGTVVSQGGGNVGPGRIVMSTATEKRIYLGGSVLILKK